MLWGLNRAERLPCLVGFCYSLCFSDNFGAEKLYWMIVGKLYINLHLDRKSRKLPRVGTAKLKRRRVFISQVRSISLLPELTLILDDSWKALHQSSFETWKLYRRQVFISSRIYFFSPWADSGFFFGCCSFSSSLLDLMTLDFRLRAEKYTGW